MDRRAFLIYMNQFEQQVVGPGITDGLFGQRVWAPIQNGKLHSSELAQLLGTRFLYSRPAVIEYYGLHKRSTGFMEKAVRLNGLLSGFECPFVNFSAIRDRHIKDLAPELLLDFCDFKQAIIQVRFPPD